MGAVIGYLSSSVCECATCLACGCVSHIVEVSLSSATRIGHLLILVTTFLAAVALTAIYPSYIEPSAFYTNIVAGTSCDGSEQCVYQQMTLRATFALVILFGALAMLSVFDECANKGLWSLKFLVSLGIMVSFLWVSDDFFAGFAVVSLFCSIFWLLAQGLLMIDLSHDMHDILIGWASKESEEGTMNKWYLLYLLLSVGFLASAGVGLYYIFSLSPSCSVPTAFGIVTVTMGVITTIVSLLDLVGKGLLTPSMLFSYSVMTSWYALSSMPASYCPAGQDIDDYTHDQASERTWSIVMTVITGLLMLYCVAQGSRILNIFNPEGEGLLTSSGSTSGVQMTQTGTVHQHLIDRDNHLEHTATENQQPVSSSSTSLSGTSHERVFFHVLLSLSSLYLCMVLTDWNQDRDNSGSRFTGLSAMWIKTVSQWAVILMHCKVLWVTYRENS